ncbi:hypothetical protein ACFE04_018882 [Oxalis oulophora]
MMHNNNTMPIYPIEDLPSPFADTPSNLSDSELRETAYEVLIGACRSSGSGRPLTFNSAKNSGIDRRDLTTSASMQRSLTSSAASRVKKALGMKSKKRVDSAVSQKNDSVRAKTVGELVRVQMKVSEQTDSRTRRALLRIAAGQLGRRMESMVLPLELLQQLKPSDFPNQAAYEAWQRRNLKLLEAGLLLYPHVPLDKGDNSPIRLQQIIRSGMEKPIDTGRISESMQSLRNVVVTLASRSVDGSPAEICHWADGFPFNLWIYNMLLEACFDVNDDTLLIEEVDEVLELVKKTWVILGINQMVHNLSLLWILFHRYVMTGQVESDLLYAANNLLVEVQKDAKANKDNDYCKYLSSIVSAVLGWAEKRLLAYRDNFHSGNTELMETIVSLAVLSAQILVEDISNEYRRKRNDVDVTHERIETYIKSSMRAAFAQVIKKFTSSKQSINQNNPSPVLATMAQDLSEIAFNEKAIISPILKRYHPLPAGVAVATFHSCFGKELKYFVSTTSELSPDAIKVLRAADKLERDLVQIAVEDAVDSEDGGKSIIQAMPPYEAEAVISNLVKLWIKTRVDTLKEWVDRNLQQEIWSPQANKERFAPSAVEVLRTVDETIEAFFLLPIPTHSTLLPDLMTGLDKCLQNYISKAKSGCGTKNTSIPPMPPLTRCTTGSKFGVFRKRDKTQLSQRRKGQLETTNGTNSFGIPQLCVRMNSLHYIRSALDALEKRTRTQLQNSEPDHLDIIENGNGKKFELSAMACIEGVQQLSESTGYKVIFQDSSQVLWDSLYIGEVSNSRIEPFLSELEHYLEIISSTVHDRVRTRVITDVMKASFDGFLLVLLAGGPSRNFTLQDFGMIEEDFKFLVDLFWSNGDGLPTELIEKFAVRVKSILPLFQTDTETLIERLKSVILENYGASAKSRLPLPPTSGEWNPSDPNTLLRVLCYRNDDLAAKFLKKTYNLPKKL